MHDSLSEIGARTLLTALEGIESGTLRPRPQPSEGVTYAAKINKSEAVIDWTRSADEIGRKVRAFNPWPVAESRLDGEQLRIYAVTVASSTAGTPGTITVTPDGEVMVACGVGALTLKEVQRPGKRPISARDWANTSSLAGRHLG